MLLRRGDASPEVVFDLSRFAVYEINVHTLGELIRPLCHRRHYRDGPVILPHAGEGAVCAPPGEFRRRCSGAMRRLWFAGRAKNWDLAGYESMRSRRARRPANSSHP